ncbi:hypothetical protein [Massilia suwonensis]|uniref:Uncharacterized protein n=1 Tax=Massilia suwonensis TaxID=648895 RepID=A0ABW0MR56_9BURK
MRITKKCLTGAQRLHAALVETDPASPDLILIRASGFLRLPQLRMTAMSASCPAHAHRAPPGTGYAGRPCRRRAAPNKSDKSA